MNQGHIAGIILGMRSANEMIGCIEAPPLMSWDQTQNNPCFVRDIGVDRKKCELRPNVPSQQWYSGTKRWALVGRERITLSATNTFFFGAMLDFDIWQKKK